MNSEAIGPHAYLQLYLAPLALLLQRRDVTDIFVNAPDEAWVETSAGGLERHAISGLDETNLWRLARQIASFSHQGISREHPLLAANLPDGARVQIIAPPATRAGLAMSIRKHVRADLTLDELATSGAFDAVRSGEARPCPRDALRGLLAQGHVTELLRRAVQARQNIVISGGTSTGKTTFANALMAEIPAHERLIVIEDAPEIQIGHANAIGLVAVRGVQGEALVSTDDLLQASLRMRPDRIIVGELRGGEALSFVRAANTGHPGSITTVHADHPEGALSQIALMMGQAGFNLSRAEREAYVSDVVDIWVQLARQGGRRLVAEVRIRED